MVSSLPINFSLVEIGLLAALVLLLVVIAAVFILQGKNRGISEALFRSQIELVGRLSQMSEYNSIEQNKISQAINEQKLGLLKIIDEKLLQVSQKVGEGLQQSAAKTNETLTALRERLVKIDAAQQKISSLSEQVVSLQEVLSNKQARGAFGEIQLNDIVTSILPPSAYSFQVVLSNQKRADCVLNLPNPPGTIIIDSKFPLESYNALRNAEDERQKLEAARFFKASVLKHIKDIAEKYIIRGETAESALMFLPSESVYAELHANFVDVVEISYRSKVWIVSPTTLMATLNTVRAILKDARMQEQAGVIQKEVGLLIEDICRLDDRVDNLSKHFEMANKDINEIKISSAKISKRIDKIEEIELDSEERAALMHQKAVD
jgi:DNA recombination protein RmuC